MLIFSTTVGAQVNSCGGQAAMFNVFENGKVGVTADAGPNSFRDFSNPADCSYLFSNAQSINVTKENLFGFTNAAAGSIQKCGLNPSGETVNRLPLPVFPSLSSETEVEIENYVSTARMSIKTTKNKTDTYYLCTKSSSSDKYWSSDRNCGDISKLVSEKTDNSTYKVDMSNPNGSPKISGTLRHLSNQNKHVQVDVDKNTFIFYLYTKNSTTAFFPGEHFIKYAHIVEHSNLVNSLKTGRVNLYVHRFVSTNPMSSEENAKKTGPNILSACINVNASCVDNSNIRHTDIDASQQNPERFAIFVYTGDLKFANSGTLVAAAVYLDQGTMYWDADENTIFVGEMAAQNIWVKHRDSKTRFFRHQDTGVFGTISPGSGDIKVGLYSPSRPAVDAQGAAGSLTFLTYQRDISSAPAQKYYGTVRAFALNADGSSEAIATWDAPSQSNKSDRQTKLSAGPGSVIMLNNASLSSESPDRIWGGPEQALASRWQGLLGRPQNTQPVIFRDILLFSSSDGFVYAVNKTSGKLKWAWSPPAQINKMDNLTNYQAQIEANPMNGQLGAVRHDNVNYVFGTAQGGALHFALQLDENFGLVKTLWIDERVGKTSPNSETPIHSNGRLIYVVDNKLVIRTLATGAEIYNALPMSGTTISSSPYVFQESALSDPEIYLGTSVGDVFKSSLPSKIPNNWSWTRIGSSPSLLASEPVMYILFTKTSDGSYLSFQSDSRITTYKLDINKSNNNNKKDSDSWSPLWSSWLNGSQLRNESTDKLEVSALIPSLPAKISDKASTLGGFVFVPVTVSQSTRGCDSDARLYLIPIDPNFSYYKAFKDGSQINASYVSIGSGRAYTAQAIYLSGKFIVQGHSEQNSPATKLGLDDPIELRPIPPNSGPGRRSWREIIR